METDEVQASAPAALPAAATTPGSTAREQAAAPAAKVAKETVSDSDDDDDDDDSDDSSFHGSDDDSGSGDGSDSDSDGGGKAKRNKRAAKARRTGSSDDATGAPAQDFDFGIDADELRDVREAAIEMYGESILREGADGNAGGGRALAKDALDKLWSDMLSEALLPTSIRSLEQGLANAPGSDGVSNSLASMGPRKRRYNALAGAASAGALSAVDHALLKANIRAAAAAASTKRLRRSADGSSAAAAVLDRVQAFGAPLENALAAQCSGEARAAGASSPHGAMPASKPQLRQPEAAALRAAIAASLAAQGRGKGSSSETGPVGSPDAADRPYFVTCDRSDVLGRPTREISGAGLWMAPNSRRGQGGVSAAKQAMVSTSAACGSSASERKLDSAATQARQQSNARTEAAWEAVSGASSAATLGAGSAADASSREDASLLSNSSHTRFDRRALASSSDGLEKEDLRSRLLAAAAAARETLAGRRIAVKQTVKFAGQTITVTRLVDAGTQAAKTVMAAASKPAAAAASGKAPHPDAGLGAAAASIGPFVPGAGAGAGAGASSSSGGGGGGVGIGAELANLDRPDAISTLAKSSLDWDSYKATQGLDDELAGAAKEGVGYVGKQAFLARVEQRQDDAALAKRAAERARASAASAAAAGSGF